IKRAGALRDPGSIAPFGLILWLCLERSFRYLPLMTRCRSRLVDLLVAPSGVARANLYRGSGVLEAEVVGLGAVLEDAYLVLGVAGVGHSLYAYALVGVVARAGDGERL